MRTKPAMQRDLLSAAVLHVRSGKAVSRSSLATTLGLAPSTAGLYVDQLIGDGYVNESGVERGAVGRPKRTLTTVSDAGWFAGVEFNAERVQAVRVDFSGKLVAAHSRPLPDGSDAKAVLQAIKSIVASLAKNTKQRLLAIGVGAPGVVDPETGVSSGYALIREWESVPIAEFLQNQFDAAVVAENNLRAIALAERWFGGGRHLPNYVILGPRSGFGVALVQGGRLIGGAHHAAGEIGHWLWPRNGDTGLELQARLSAPAAWRRLAGAAERARLPANLHTGLAAYAGTTGPVWDELVMDYAGVIGCLQLLVDTEIFFLHGPLTALEPRFCADITAAIRARFPTLAKSNFKLIASNLGDDAGALGAASLAMEAWAPTI
jgi:predicted NBD/HSP70 family sugar kinase